MTSPIRTAGLALAALVVGTAPTIAADTPAKFWVFVGTYTGDKAGKGIYRYEFDPATGKLTGGEVAAETRNPSFLAVHPTNRFLYAVGEIGDFGGKNQGAVNAFALDAKTGALSPLNQQASGGSGPCHLVVDKAGKNVLVANYGSGSAAVLPVGTDGKLAEATSTVQHKGTGSNPSRQEGPHAHSINLDANNRFAVVADLGLDQVFVYAFDPAKGTITPNTPPAFATMPGAGPRHFAFHPSAPYAYVINELNSSLTALAYDAGKGTFKELQTLSTLPEGAKVNNSTAEVQVHPSGKFVYGSNRGHNSIAAFAVDAKNGKLTLVGHQGEGIKTPRNFGIDPTGHYLLVANQDGDSIVVFAIDADTGALKPTGVKVDVPKPVCVKFVPRAG